MPPADGWRAGRRSPVRRRPLRREARRHRGGRRRGALDDIRPAPAELVGRGANRHLRCGRPSPASTMLGAQPRQEQTCSSYKAARRADTVRASTTRTKATRRCSSCSLRCATLRPSARRNGRDHRPRDGGRCAHGGRDCRPGGHGVSALPGGRHQRPYRRGRRARRADRDHARFHGRRARGIVNSFMREHPDAPSAYPQINYVTAPIRAAARAGGTTERINLWAGTARRARAGAPGGRGRRRATPVVPRGVGRRGSQPRRAAASPRSRRPAHRRSARPRAA